MLLKRSTPFPYSVPTLIFIVIFTCHPSHTRIGLMQPNTAPLMNSMTSQCLTPTIAQVSVFGPSLSLSLSLSLSGLFCLLFFRLLLCLRVCACLDDGSPPLMAQSVHSNPRVQLAARGHASGLSTVCLQLCSVSSCILRGASICPCLRVNCSKSWFASHSIYFFFFLCSCALAVSTFSSCFVA